MSRVAAAGAFSRVVDEVGVAAMRAVEEKAAAAEVAGGGVDDGERKGDGDGGRRRRCRPRGGSRGQRPWRRDGW